MDATLNQLKIFHTSDGDIDVDTIARKRLPHTSLIGPGAHQFQSVTLGPAEHTIPNMGDIRVKYMLKINNTPEARDQETGEGKRSWILHGVKIMRYTNGFMPDISNQARILLSTVGLIAENMPVGKNGPKHIDVKSVIKYLKSKKLEFDTDLATGLKSEEAAAEQDSQPSKQPKQSAKQPEQPDTPKDDTPVIDNIDE